ncbi:MAG: glycerol-3-phosphate acyltransferase, partial [Armatimonadota bacterium]
MLLSFIITLLVCYLLGSVPVGVIVGRARGIDIREFGSKNIGATNVYRTLG